MTKGLQHVVSFTVTESICYLCAMTLKSNHGKLI